MKNGERKREKSERILQLFTFPVLRVRAAAGSRKEKIS